MSIERVNQPGHGFGPGGRDSISFTAPVKFVSNAVVLATSADATHVLVHSTEDDLFVAGMGSFILTPPPQLAVGTYYPHASNAGEWQDTDPGNAAIELVVIDEVRVLIRAASSINAGGYTPFLFYAYANDTSNLGTSLSPVDWSTGQFVDTGYTQTNESGTRDVVTIGADLDGKRARVDWMVGGEGATDIVEIRTELQVDPDGVSGYTTVKEAANNTAHDSTQDTGGVVGHHYMTLATGMKIRISALRDGSTANKRPLLCSLSIETKS